MRFFFSFILLSALSVKAFSQPDSGLHEYKPVAGKGADDKIFSSVDQLPEFAGGQQGLMDYLSRNIQYPADAREKNIEGRVVVRFVVCTDGSLCNETIVKSVDSAMDQEVLRVVKAMPGWKPGRQNGVPVKTYYTLPVSFKLQGQEKDSNIPDAREYLSQQEAPVMEKTEEKVFTSVENAAEFPGGMRALQKFLAKNTKYPDEAVKNKIFFGRAVLQFIVNKDGSISDIVIQRDVPQSGFGAESVRVLSMMPNWKPGRIKGQAVRMYYTLPITFRRN